MDGIRIPLTRGRYALVSPEDYAHVAQYKWCLAVDGRGMCYAKRGETRNGKQHTVRMHRFILNAPDGTQVDHVNGDGLDNRRGNLRLATPSDNEHNSRRRHTNRSGFKGVWLQTCGRGWLANIAGEHLGVYDTAEEAARAYDTRARERFGAFARLNFPDDWRPVLPRRGGPHRVNTSGYNGVSFRKHGSKWTARLTHGGRRLYLGYFASAEEAHAAIMQKAAELHGAQES